MKLFVNLLVFILSFIFLYFSYLVYKKLINNKEYKKGEFRKDADYVSDWEGNKTYLFYAIDIIPKRGHSPRTPENSCRSDNIFSFQASDQTYVIDTKKISSLNISRKYKGILKSSFAEMTEDAKYFLQHGKIDCEYLKELFLRKRGALTKPFIIFGYRGFEVNEWYLKDGETGYIKTRERGDIYEVLDKSSFLSSKIVYLLLAGFFFLFSSVTFYASFLNLMAYIY